MTATSSLSAASAPQIRANALALLPALIVAGAAMLLVVGGPLLVPLLLGAAGWFAALILRQPVAILASKGREPAAAARIVGWFSGPAEELVRVALIVFFVGTVDQALWFGFGWAALEIVLVAVNVFAVSSLVTKDDAKSREARDLLEAQGMLQIHHPAWGFIERLSATALHIGFTLLLFASPWLVLLTLPLHSATNMVAVRFARTRIALTELVLAVIGAVVLAAGVLATGL